MIERVAKQDYPNGGYKMKTDKRILIIPDFMVVLKALEGITKTTTDLHYETRITYSHVHAIKTMLIEKGWATTQEDGKRKNIVLTNEGVELVKAVNEVLTKLGITAANINEFRAKTKIKYKGIKEPVIETPKKEEEPKMEKSSTEEEQAPFTDEEKEELFLEDEDNDIDDNERI